MVKNPQRSTKVTLQHIGCEQSQYRKMQIAASNTADCSLKYSNERLVLNPSQIEPRTQLNSVTDRNHCISNVSHFVLRDIQTTAEISKAELPLPCELSQLECTPLSLVPLTPSPHNIFVNMDYPGPMNSSSYQVFNPNASANDLNAAFLLGDKWACINQASISGFSLLRL